METNVALLTENRPVPRVTTKTDKAEDQDAAALSELTIEYLWEALNMPNKHRKIARLILASGVSWMEIVFDPTIPRRLTVPEMESEKAAIAPLGIQGAPLPEVNTQVERQVIKRDDEGIIQYTDRVEYGDITANIVSPFEMHIPSVHWWDSEEMGWVMREYYTSKEALRDKYLTPPKQKNQLTKSNGWYLDNLEKVSSMNVTDLPVWWWERLGQLVEGSGSTFFVGNPELWSDHTVVRIFDRKPNKEWPRGRTTIIAGDQILYDSPKNIGARAYDPRWPNRWHPYIKFSWEEQPASDIYCRSLVSKLLPKLKRVNAIDTTMIMWRRTVPIASWIVPKGTSVVEDFFAGKPGTFLEYDPRRTATAKPEPVLPPPYPQAAIEERNLMIQEMEAIAGTEEILRGQRPSGVNSAMMLDVLRKQALASRSAILQGWDESLQDEAAIMLQETIKHIKDDPRYAERLRILAREKQSKLSIKTFSGQDLSDNVIVRVDTASQALVSKEARQAKALEFLQYSPGLMAIPNVGLRQAIVEELGFKKALTPQGPDVDRAKKMIALVKQNRFDRVVPMIEDDPYVFHELLVNEMKADYFFDLAEVQQGAILRLIEMYQQAIQFREQQRMQQAIQMAQLQGGGPQQPQGPPEGQQG
jgi:hypothetical protein